MGKYYTTREISEITNLSLRSVQRRIQTSPNVANELRVVNGRSITYHKSILKKLFRVKTINTPILDTEFSHPEKKEDTASNTELKKRIQELEHANEMLNFQITANYEMINDLRKDKEHYKKQMEQLIETIKGSLMNTHSAQQLNYLDKEKGKEG